MRILYPKIRSKKSKQKLKTTLESLLIFASMIFCLNVSAQNIGVYGQIYTIAEPDLLSFIHDRLLQYKEDGQLNQMETNFKKRVQESVLEPEPVSGVSDSTLGDTAIVFYYTPSVTLQQNILDANGKILFKKGTVINPLDQQSVSKVAPNTIIPKFNETLLFINANQQSQITFAKHTVSVIQNNNPFAIYKIILVNGNLKRASAALGRIYFDQKGILYHLFGIHRVPAIVTRLGDRLKITEPVI